MKRNNKKKIPTADEIAEMADRGEDVTKFFGEKWEMRPGVPREDVQRVNVDFTTEMLSELDAEARRLNISRQAVIKTLVSDALDRRLHARKLGRSPSAKKAG
jgi:hypothetical protein